MVTVSSQSLKYEPGVLGFVNAWPYQYNCNGWVQYQWTIVANTCLGYWYDGQELPMGSAYLNTWSAVWLVIFADGYCATQAAINYYAANTAVCVPIQQHGSLDDSIEFWAG
jgi:hypothetical protein